MAKDLDIHADKVALPTHWTGELKALLALGVPMAATQLVQFFVYTIDVIMIGRVSADALAASSLGLVVVFLLWMIGSGPVSAVTPLVSQALGAKQQDYDDVRYSVRMALWVVALMSPLVLLAVYFTEDILIFFGQDANISAMAGDYVLMVAFGLPFALGIMALRNFLAAINKTTVPLFLVMITTALNALFNYVLIFGHWGFPRLELVGAGIASSISYALSFLLFALYVSWDREAKPFRIFHQFTIPHWPRFRETIALGWPISVTTIFEGLLFNACVLLMGIIGKLEIAAYQIALNVAAMAFMLPWGLSMAGSVRVGLAAGARNHEAVKRAAVITLIVSVLGIGLFAVPITLMPEFIASLYLDSSGEDKIAVQNWVIAFLPLAAGFMFFDAVQVASNQLLRGLKDVRAPIWLTGISFWLIGFPAAWYLGLRTGVGAYGIWYGLMASLIMASILLGGRLYWMIWKTGRYKLLVKATQAESSEEGKRQAANPQES